MITVKDLRQLVFDLPDNAPVLINWERGETERYLEQAYGAHDGRYGPVIVIKLGGFVEPWKARNQRLMKEGR